MFASTRRLAVASTIVLIALGLSGCAGTVAMTPAAEAKSVGCAEVTVRLPDAIGGHKDAQGIETSIELPQRTTNAQATGAWGEPVAVLLWCGVDAPGPTTQECVEVNGVDWIIDDSDAPKYRFTTFGREPAVSVVIDNTLVSGTTAITDLSSAVSVTRQVDRCLSLTDVPAD